MKSMAIDHYVSMTGLATSSNQHQNLYFLSSIASSSCDYRSVEKTESLLQALSQYSAVQYENEY